MGNNKNSSLNGTIKNYKAEIYATTLNNKDRTNVEKINAEIDRLEGIRRTILSEKLLEKLNKLSCEYGELCSLSIKESSDFKASDLRKKAKELNDMQEKVIQHSDLVKLIDHLISELKGLLDFRKVNSPFNKKRTLREVYGCTAKEEQQDCPGNE